MLPDYMQDKTKPDAGAADVRHFDVFISHATKDSSFDCFTALNAFFKGRDKLVFNPTTHLTHVPKIDKAAMQDAVKRSSLVLAALSKNFFASKWFLTLHTYTLPLQLVFVVWDSFVKMK